MSMGLRLAALLATGAPLLHFSSSVEKYFTSERGERVKYFSTWDEKFRISKRPCNFCYIKSSQYINILKTTFLTIFRRFPKILQKLFEGHTNVSENFRRLPKRGRRLLKTFKGSKMISKMISSQAGYRFYRFATTRYTTKFYIINEKFSCRRADQVITSLSVFRLNIIG